MAESSLDRAEDLDGLAHHFRADSVAGKNHDRWHQWRLLRMPQAVMDCDVDQNPASIQSK
jgi:hypothetical protein